MFTENHVDAVQRWAARGVAVTLELSVASTTRVHGESYGLFAIRDVRGLRARVRDAGDDQDLDLGLPGLEAHDLRESDSLTIKRAAAAERAAATASGSLKRMTGSAARAAADRTSLVADAWSVLQMCGEVLCGIGAAH